MPSSDLRAFWPFSQQHAAGTLSPRLHPLAQLCATCWLTRLPGSTNLQAARLRKAWRAGQGAITLKVEGADIKVRDAHLLQPHITIQPDVPSSPAHTLVAEMMIMAGEAAGALGEPFLLDCASVMCSLL